ncbi:hypothetical protein D3C81_836200 [compost metagenome]
MDLLLLFIVQPARLFGPVSQPETPDHSEQYGGKTGQDKQHLPVTQPQPAMQVRHDGAGQGPTDHAGDHAGHEKRGGDAAAYRGGKPVGEVKNQTREKARLGDTQQEARDDQLAGAGDKGGGHRDQAPEDHDPRERGTRADTLHVQVARHLEEDVAQVENPGADAIGGIGKEDVFGHAQFGERQVQAVDGVDDEGQHQIRHQTPDNFGVGAFQLG